MQLDTFPCQPYQQMARSALVNDDLEMHRRLVLRVALVPGPPRGKRLAQMGQVTNCLRRNCVAPCTVAQHQAKLPAAPRLVAAHNFRTFASMCIKQAVRVAHAASRNLRCNYVNGRRKNVPHI